MSTITIDGRPADRAAWLEERRSFIGGSDVPVVLGLKPSKVRLWLSKLGRDAEDPGPTAAMRRGLRLEPYIAEAYGEITGDPIVRTQVVVRHPDLPFCGATIDGITASGRIVEFKTSGLYGPVRKVDGPDDFEVLPEAWMCQGAHQLLCTGQADMMFAVVTPDLELNVIGPWPRPDNLCAIIARECEAFWRDHVESNVPPDEVHHEDARALARAFRGQTGEWLVLGERAGADAVRHRRLGAEIRALEEERGECEARLRLALGDAGGAELPGGWSVTRKEITVNHKAKEAWQSKYVRLYVHEPKEQGGPES